MADLILPDEVTAERKAAADRARKRSMYRFYEAATGGPFRASVPGSSSADSIVGQAGSRLRDIGRYLDENHDLAVGILDELVCQIVGTGSRPEPLVQLRGGELAERTNDAIRMQWAQYAEAPEVTGTMPWGEYERLCARSWLRDGEVFVQLVEGRFRGDPFRDARIPFAVEPLEADFVPFDLHLKPKTGDNRRVVHGIELNQWRRPVGYHVHINHPRDALTSADLHRTKVVPADRMLHPKFCRRLGQTRGVSIFAAVLTRLQDIKDYEESERIAARIAASLTAVIQRHPDLATPETAKEVQDSGTGEREFSMSAGMVFDNLLPGETVQTIDSNRPNQGLTDFRASQLRAAATGTMSSYSSIARIYDASYSASRQERTDSAPRYEMLRSYWIARHTRPIYRRWLAMAIASGEIPLEAGIDPETLDDVDYSGVAVPWVDPMKEVQADALAVKSGFVSRRQVQRKRGFDPRQMDRERELDTFEIEEPDDDGETTGTVVPFASAVGDDD